MPGNNLWEMQNIRKKLNQKMEEVVKSFKEEEEGWV